MWNRTNHQQSGKKHSELYKTTSFATNDLQCDECGRDDHDRTSCLTPSTCFLCGSAMHTIRSCDAIDARAQTAAKETMKKRQGPKDLLEFDPPKDPSLSNISDGRPLDHLNLKHGEAEEQGKDISDSSAPKAVVNDTILDEPITELDQPAALADQGERVQVALKRKRKGKKGKSSTYDLTPYLSY